MLKQEQDFCRIGYYLFTAAVVGQSYALLDLRYRGVLCKSRGNLTVGNLHDMSTSIPIRDISVITIAFSLLNWLYTIYNSWKIDSRYKTFGQYKDDNPKRHALLMRC